MPLPVEQALPALRSALAAHSGAVLIAPPGAGKTTRVPLALLGEPWLGGQRIVMLEPRRLAARATAAFMARQLGEGIGQTVGYRVRMDTRVSRQTRIEVITEGVLTRMLQSDPGLDGVGLLIFDEFHERSLQADLGLALALQAQSLLRPELRLLVMSATLAGEPVAELLGGAPLVVSEGRSYPVETRYAERTPEGRMEAAVVRTVASALSEEPGDVLVFLPGAAEIRRTAEGLAALEAVRGKVQLAPLHGSLSPEEQDRALAPAADGRRKIVLATSIAETSLTVEGVRVVVDSGLMRVPRFSPRTGLTRLVTVPVSQASADQRRGRAGRLTPGVCYRLWTEAQHRQLPARTAPEVLEADLAPLALELAAWGVAEPAELAWLDLPPAAAMAQARELLRQLGAIDGGGGLTPHGRRMAALGLHPRLAHMLLRAEPLGLGALACELAALLGERDLLRVGGRPPSADIRLRVEALRSGVSPVAGVALDPAVCRSLRAEARLLRQTLGLGEGNAAAPADACGLLLAFAYPDRIAQRRGTGRFVLASGRGAQLPELQPLSTEPYIVAAELDDLGTESRIDLAAALDEVALERHFADRLTEEREVMWDRAAGTVRARRRVKLGALVLREGALQPRPEEMTAALLEGIRAEGLELLPWTRAARQLQQRLRFMHRQDASWPDASDETLLETLEDWLAPRLEGRRGRDALQSLPMATLLEELLPWDKRRELAELAPTHLAVPSGSRIPVDYSDPEAPFLAVRLQELFGLAETPRIARGRVPVTVHLLSPASRPVQVTRDLASFWRSAYFEVKKDLKGRYPKHYWPDDPTAAVPTSRVRPRG